jgi:hypothetical protein
LQATEANPVPTKKPWHQLEEDRFENEAPILAVPNSLVSEIEKLADGEGKKEEKNKKKWNPKKKN